MGVSASDPLGTNCEIVVAIVDRMDSTKSKLAQIGGDTCADVDAIIAYANWQGDAAESFRLTWEQDYASIGAIMEYIADNSKPLHDLIDNLRSLNRTFQNSIDDARAKQVPLGPNFEPPAYAQVLVEDQSGRVVGVAFQESPAGVYAYDYDRLHAAALEYQLQAAGSLVGLHDVVAKSGGSQAGQVDLASLLNGLYSDMKVVPGVDGAPSVTLETKLTAPLKDMGSLARGIGNFLDDVPVVDLAVTMVGAQIQYHELVNEGDDPSHASAVSGQASVAGMFVGGVVTAGVIIAFGSGGWVVAGALVLGTIAGIGASDLYTDFFNEHWDEDFHGRDPISGGAIGLSHVVGNTIQDTMGDTGDAVRTGIDDVAGVMGGLGIHF